MQRTGQRIRHENPLWFAVVQDRVQMCRVKQNGAGELPFRIVILLVLDLGHKIIETPIGVDF
jgi:hypothetical protein